MTDPTEKLSELLPLSPDHNSERLTALKRLFPDIFTNEGQLNLDELKKVIDPALVSETERYDFRWYGKTASKRDAFTPSCSALVQDTTRAVNPQQARGNMIIEGENLEVLKLLSSAYRERIKCIYIDPPYNTGSDFVYSDRFAEGQKPYWEQTGITEDGLKVDTNTDSDGRFHSNWLSMMHSRLLVARYLLRPDGVILVSIGDHEMQNLRRLLDEVFGEENFIQCIIWKKRNGPPPDKEIGGVHEYIFAYSREREALKAYLKPRTPDDIAGFKNPDNHPKGVWEPGDLTANVKGGRYVESLNYPIKNPNTGEEHFPGTEGTNGNWRYNSADMKVLLDNNEIYFGAKGLGRPQRKRFLKELKDGTTFSTLWDSVGFNQHGSDDIETLLGSSTIFDNPKPVSLINEILKFTTRENDIVLDFFGGSGTTAQAVIELNKIDGGRREFILIQIPEFTATDSPAYNAGFKKISDITIGRTKRVIEKLKNEVQELLPNDPQRQFVDGLGFKIFKLSKSNFPRVEFAPDPDKTEAENIELLKDYIRAKEATFHFQWERETVLDEVLLRNGFILDYALTRRTEFSKNEVFLAKDAFKESLICLDAVLAPETVDYFKTHKDYFFICLELALDTTKKWNLKHHLGDKLKTF
jgi:adenine-specific DNA-methyltransferase